MESRQGMSASQARKLLELADQNGCYCNVKVFDKDIRSKPGRAILKQVLNERQVVVHPFKHKKDEIVNLSDVFFWKTGCDFDISEAEKMIAAEAPVQTISPIGAHISQVYVILSRKYRSVWGGERRGWVNKIHLASTWSTREMGDPALKRLSKIPMTSDAEIVTREQAHEFFESSKEPTSLSAAAETAASLPKASDEAKADEGNLEFDGNEIASILSFDPSLIVAAQKAVSVAAQGVQSAEKMLEEEKQKLAEAIERFKKLTAPLSSQLETPKPQKAAKAKASGEGGTPRGAVRAAVRAALFPTSRLDMATLTAKAKGMTPSSSDASIKQCIYSLREVGEIEKDNSGNWLLTVKGRSMASKRKD